MKTCEFDFDLPADRIAKFPVSPRDAARLLVVRPDRSPPALRDEQVASLPQLLQPGDVMLFNDSRVIPARLYGSTGGTTTKRVEITLHKEYKETPQSGCGCRWQVFAKPARKLCPGDIFVIADDFCAQIVEKLPDGQVVLLFDYPREIFFSRLQAYGKMPLPPYMRRDATADDRMTYQTIYARHDGSVAAPTAGLHFTPQLLAALDARGIERLHVTLHVGGGTFLPVKAEDTQDHVMHSEYAALSAEVAAAINQAKREGRRIIAVGTTALRTLESATDTDGIVHPIARETDIFITPGYNFRCVDILLTNFHLPRSTLFMLVAAFSGLTTMKQAYAHAITGGYRFYSYGDACLLYRQK